MVAKRPTGMALHINARFRAIAPPLPFFVCLYAGHPQPMLTEIYIEALLVDEELADRIWEAWSAGEIDDQLAWWAWWLVAINAKQTDQSSTTLRS